jgi:ATP-dependent DNA helicase RecG
MPSSTESPVPMNRLLQGDVGSGKTIIAAFACLIAIKNGYQAAIMAPTEVLARQHFVKVRELLEKEGLNILMLIGRWGSLRRSGIAN